MIRSQRNRTVNIKLAIGIILTSLLWLGGIFGLFHIFNKFDEISALWSAIGLVVVILLGVILIPVLILATIVILRLSVSFRV